MKPQGRPLGAMIRSGDLFGDPFGTDAIAKTAESVKKSAEIILKAKAAELEQGVKDAVVSGATKALVWTVLLGGAGYLLYALSKEGKKTVNKNQKG